MSLILAVNGGYKTGDLGVMQKWLPYFTNALASMRTRKAKTKLVNAVLLPFSSNASISSSC